MEKEQKDKKMMLKLTINTRKTVVNNKLLKRNFSVYIETFLQINKTIIPIASEVKELSIMVAKDKMSLISDNQFIIASSNEEIQDSYFKRSWDYLASTKLFGTILPFFGFTYSKSLAFAMVPVLGYLGWIPLAGACKGLLTYSGTCVVVNTAKATGLCPETHPHSVVGLLESYANSATLLSHQAYTFLYNHCLGK
jgi:hypothetical protein